ncbi:pyridoxal phosphate-dependent transferase [Diplogelasinospora grovesii]|uniref:Pyridoxal phosphate-dependent transferase n=1 Tax=Diplogelasinospora grovesii TaxID=303347 RepID=A0AAN6NJ53_9PEZI|nr:pyridoxal phosphate-dependent transferase [Diplogelasinospora grovesii]
MDQSPSRPLAEHFLGGGQAQDEEVLGFLQRVVQLGVSFKSSEPVFTQPRPARTHVSFESMPADGISLPELLGHFEDLAGRSSNWGSPAFLGFPDSGNSVPGIGASLLVPLLNQNLANQDICAPEATFLEMEVVHWLRELMGYTVPARYATSAEIGGVLTLGGCLSNTIAMVAARERLFPRSGWEGLPVPANVVRLLVPDIIEHYSMRSAMSWLSLGEKNVIRVPVDDTFRMQPSALERIIDEQRAQGNYILACVAYAGDSRSMSIDNLDSLATLLAGRDVWFHVDACHGSQLAFSEPHRRKLRGIERADSITIDPHKVLWIPNTCSFVLFKEPRSLANVATNSDLILKTQWSLGQITPFIGSKAFDALKLWATIKFFGQAGLSRLIDDRLRLTASIQREVARRDDLLLLNSTDINSCMMMFIPRAMQQHYRQRSSAQLADADLEKLNAINVRIRDAVIKEGSCYVHGFPLRSCRHELLRPGRPTYVLRTMNGNPRTTIDHVVRVLDMIVGYGQECFASTRYRVLQPPDDHHHDHHHHDHHHHDDRMARELQRVTGKLDALLRDIFAAADTRCCYAAVLYGSSAYDQAALLSDIDLMVFAPDAVIAGAVGLRTAVHSAFLSVMAEEGIMVDAEVPFERKLLVSTALADAASTGGGITVESGSIVGIRRTRDYLASDEMLQRLVFNVLTTPSRVISGDPEILVGLAAKAETTLVRLIGAINPGQFSLAAYDANHAETFTRLAISDGRRYGEDYLGYKDRSGVALKLNRIFFDACKTNQGSASDHGGHVTQITKAG